MPVERSETHQTQDLWASLVRIPASLDALLGIWVQPGKPLFPIDPFLSVPQRHEIRDRNVRNERLNSNRIEYRAPVGRLSTIRQPDGQISSDFRNPCQAENFCKSKIFLLSSDPNQCASVAIPSYSEGRRPSSRTLGGLRWTLVYAETMAWMSVRQNRVVLAPVAGVKLSEKRKRERQ